MVINEEKTFKKFGYRSTDLSHGSGYKIVDECPVPGCGKERDIIMDNWRPDIICNSCACKRRWANKEYRESQTETLTVANTSEERIEKFKVSSKRRWDKEEEHEKARIAQQKRWEREEEHEKASAGQKKRFEDPAEREKARIAQTGKLASEATKLKMSIAHSGENNPNYGKSPSEKTRKKMSIAKSGKNHPMWGKHLSPETCKKIAISGENHYLYGKSPSEETCKKLSTNIRKAYQNKRWNSQIDNFINGNNIIDWIKPVTNNYGINYEEYDIWRHKVYIRDNYTCQICGDKDCMIHAHHIIPQRENQDLILDINNGITLCPRCHGLTFKKEILFAEELQMIINGII